MTSKNKHAFTLLELMVALAIVLIISMLAYPVMTPYFNQSKVADALLAMEPVKVLVNNQIANLGSVTNSGLNLTTPTTVSRYVSSYSINNNGVISLTTSADAGGISLTLTPVYNATSEQVSWTCAVANSNMNSSVPSECRI